jgi:type 1 fimbriae regulatory protein FimB/type 1 fimbriae regulatory protein FimE
MLVESKIEGEVPSTENRTVTPKRLKNSEYRTREYLTPDEVESLIKAAKSEGRYGNRDAVMILIAYRHGMRVKELCNLERTQIDMKAALLFVKRLKGSQDSTHPIKGDELRALRSLLRDNGSSRYVFMNERDVPVSTDGFRKTLERLSKKAGLSFKAHPHMLRHACGFKLANDGQDTRALQLYLGHKNIQHTVRYTELSSKRFDDFWKD